jgi:hypothetical protein
MKAASEEYDEDDSFDKDEIAELTEISDDRCQVADFDHMLSVQPGERHIGGSQGVSGLLTPSIHPR